MADIESKQSVFGLREEDAPASYAGFPGRRAGRSQRREPLILLSFLELVRFHVSTKCPIEGKRRAAAAADRNIGSAAKRLILIGFHKCLAAVSDLIK
jgi:hypothetical protein